MKAIIVVLALLAALFTGGTGFAQAKSKHHKSSAHTAARHHAARKATHQKHEAVKRAHGKVPATKLETVVVEGASSTAIVTIKKGTVYVNDKPVEKVANLNKKGHEIVISHSEQSSWEPATPQEPGGEHTSAPAAERAWVGVFATDYFNEGAIVEKVVPFSPGDEAGIVPGDIITGINGYNISSQQELADVLGHFNAGDEINITYKRFHTIETTKARLVDRRLQYHGSDESDAYRSRYWRRSWYWRNRW